MSYAGMSDATEPCPDCGSMKHKSCIAPAAVSDPQKGVPEEELPPLPPEIAQSIEVAQMAPIGRLRIAIRRIEERERQLSSALRALKVKDGQIDKLVEIARGYRHDKPGRHGYHGEFADINGPTTCQLCAAYDALVGDKS